MRKLMKNKDKLKSLKKAELLEICEEMVALQAIKSDRNVYSYDISKRNNNRRSLRKFWKMRNTSDVARAKVRAKIEILRGLK